jgi:hypothetical protein
VCFAVPKKATLTLVAVQLIVGIMLDYLRHRQHRPFGKRFPDRRSSTLAELVNVGRSLKAWRIASRARSRSSSALATITVVSVLASTLWGVSGPRRAPFPPRSGSIISLISLVFFSPLS